MILVDADNEKRGGHLNVNNKGSIAYLNPDTLLTATNESRAQINGCTSNQGNGELVQSRSDFTHLGLPNDQPECSEEKEGE